MQNEIPKQVSLIVKNGESQVDFAYRLFIEAAKIAGLPESEQKSFADDMIKNGEHLFLGNDGKPRLKWINDPSPKDNNPLISDLEWKKHYGKLHTHLLGDLNTQEIKRRQIYYQLEGGVLGSMQEVAPNSDVIIVNLNLLYHEGVITLDEARSKFGQYVIDARRVYEPLGIRFYVSDWSPGIASFKTVKEGDNEFLNASITKGYKQGFHNVIFGRRAGDTAEERYSLSYTTFDAGLRPIASFIYEGGLGGGGTMSSYELRKHSLAHELGHVFGILGDPAITNPTARNKDADWHIDKAVMKLLSGQIRKGVDWRRSGLILPDASGKIEYLTIFDKLRAGARAIARRV